MDEEYPEEPVLKLTFTEKEIYHIQRAVFAEASGMGDGKDEDGYSGKIMRLALNKLNRIIEIIIHQRFSLKKCT